MLFFAVKYKMVKISKIINLKINSIEIVFFVLFFVLNPLPRLLWYFKSNFFIDVVIII